MEDTSRQRKDPLLYHRAVAYGTLRESVPENTCANSHTLATAVEAIIEFLSVLVPSRMAGTTMNWTRNSLYVCILHLFIC